VAAAEGEAWPRAWPDADAVLEAVGETLGSDERLAGEPVAATECEGVG
jgi:hypothetical protein